jgi:hypothetical protein
VFFPFLPASSNDEYFQGGSERKAYDVSKEHYNIHISDQSNLIFKISSE